MLTVLLLFITVGQSLANFNITASSYYEETGSTASIRIQWLSESNEFNCKLLLKFTSNQTVVFSENITETDYTWLVPLTQTGYYSIETLAMVDGVEKSGRMSQDIAVLDPVLANHYRLTPTSEFYIRSNKNATAFVNLQIWSNNNLVEPSAPWISVNSLSDPVTLYCPLVGREIDGIWNLCNQYTIQIESDGSFTPFVKISNQVSSQILSTNITVRSKLARNAVSLIVVDETASQVYERGQAITFKANTDEAEPDSFRYCFDIKAPNGTNEQSCETGVSTLTRTFDFDTPCGDYRRGCGVKVSVNMSNSYTWSYDELWIVIQQSGANLLLASPRVPAKVNENFYIPVQYSQLGTDLCYQVHITLDSSTEAVKLFGSNLTCTALAIFSNELLQKIEPLHYSSIPIKLQAAGIFPVQVYVRNLVYTEGPIDLSITVAKIECTYPRVGLRLYTLSDYLLQNQHTIVKGNFILDCSRDIRDAAVNIEWIVYYRDSEGSDWVDKTPDLYVGGNPGANVDARVGRRYDHQLTVNVGSWPVGYYKAVYQAKMVDDINLFANAEASFRILSAPPPLQPNPTPASPPSAK